MNPIYVASFVAVPETGFLFIPSYMQLEYISDISDLSTKYTGFIIAKNTDIISLPKFVPYIHINESNLPEAIHHFLLRSIVLSRLNSILNSALTRRSVIDFHSRYKFLLLAHSQPHYRKIGPFVGTINKKTIEQFMIEYRDYFMDGLAITPTKKNHANVLSHFQGFFRPNLESEKRQHLAQLIQDYLNDKISLNEPIKQLKKYLSLYPNSYLEKQSYFKFYPEIVYS